MLRDNFSIRRLFLNSRYNLFLYELINSQKNFTIKRISDESKNRRVGCWDAVPRAKATANRS